MMSVHATEITTEQKGLSILSNVVGLDLTKYKVSTKEYLQNMSALSNVASQDNVGYTLASNQSNMNVLCTFANGSLQMLQVLENRGSPSLTKTSTSNNSDVYDLAKSFLGNYQTYASNPVYGILRSTLDLIDVDKNLTITSSNVKLEVSTFTGYTSFKWESITNGVIAPSKFVGLGFANGTLTYFVDNWQYFQIGSTNVKLSENDAKTFALKTAQEHSWSIALDSSALDLKNFNISNVGWTALIFDNSAGAVKSRGDVSVLYPVWRVGVALNKWYGNLYGIQVDIWADTGEIRAVEEAWSTINPQESGFVGSRGVKASPPPVYNSTLSTVPIANSTANSLVSGQVSIGALALSGSAIYVTAFSSAVSTICVALFFKSRENKPKVCGQQNIGSLKTFYRQRKRIVNNLLKRFGPFGCGLLLLILLVPSLTVFTYVPTAKATTPTAGAVVWGAESIGAGAYPTSTRKSQAEIDDQRIIAPMIANYFSQNGYGGNNGINHQGINNPGSSKTQILSDLSYLQSNFDKVAVVDFDHGVGRQDSYNDPNYWHYMLEDNVGQNNSQVANGTDPNNWVNAHMVYDKDIFSNTNLGKNIFSFINTCESANVSSWQQNGVGPAADPYPNEKDQGIDIGNYAVSMPYAFTHRYVRNMVTYAGFSIAQDISDDGYTHPDNGLQVYIGFPMGSASLSQKIPYSTGVNPYLYWVEEFFSAALSTQYPMTVNQALDSASIYIYGTYFGASDLRKGFGAYWWMYNLPDTAFNGSTLAVYGNGDIYLQNPPPNNPDPIPTPSLNCLTAPSYVNSSLQFSAVTTDPFGYNVYYTFNWGDGTNRTTIGPLSSGTNCQTNHTYSSTGLFSVNVSAIDSAGYPSSWSSPYSVNIQNLPNVPIIRVQGNARGTTVGVSTISVNLASLPQNGNVLVLTYGSSRAWSPGSILSISQTGVNWSRQVIGSVQAGYSGWYVDSEIWAGIVSSGSSANITVNLNSAVQEGAVDLCEYSGLLTSNFLDRNATNSNQFDGTAPDTGTTQTTSQSNELWVGSTMEYGDPGLQPTQTGASYGFTLLDGAYVANYPMYGSLAYLEHLVGSTRQAHSSTTPYTRPWVGAIATFRGASSVGGVIRNIQGNARGTVVGGSSFSFNLQLVPQNSDLLVLTFGSSNAYMVGTISSIQQGGVNWNRQISGSVQAGYSGWYIGSEIWVGVVQNPGASIIVTVYLNGVVQEASADVCEYSGLRTVNFLDKMAVNSNQFDGTLPDTGTTMATSQANELWVGSTMEYGDPGLQPTQISATNGFTLMDGAYVSNYPMYGSLAYLEKIVSSMGSADSSTTPYTRPWVGCIATFTTP
jgi:hypothetical protein